MDDKRKSAMWCNTCRSGSHNDRSCRKHKGRKTDQLNKVAEEEIEHSFLFTLKAVSNESNSGKRNSLLVDCGATSHIITDKSKFKV